MDIGSDAFLRFWKEHDVLAGREVTVTGKPLAGTARGIDASGQLRVETDSGVDEFVNAGEVSVRVA